uniref:DM5 domain-containing protein n=1 Tax=Anopheles dirus TaxID=7168 RepID=A0A182N003_9DIPT
MKVLVVLACVAIVVARPEPPVGGYAHHHHGGNGGYNYAQPAPVGGFGGHSGQFSGGAATASAGGNAFAFDTLSSGGATSSFSGASASSGAFSGSAFGSGQANTASFLAPQQQIVQKHIYVHVPPPEPEQSFQQQIVAPGLRQKHYKIIFIKTPHVQPSAAQLALQQSQTEEKTIVYVLVKKPEPLGDISLPAPTVTKPSKPEVYFIKYKTNTEEAPIGLGLSSSGAAQADAQAGLGLLSSSGVASSSATAGAQSSVVALGPAQTYGAPGHHGGYH